jgi:hypothetical protein
VKLHIYVLGALGWLVCFSLAAAARADVADAQTKAADSDVHITVIGCIQRSQPLATEAPGTTVIPAGETKYVLSKITLVPPREGAEGAAAGSTGNLVAQSVSVYGLDDAADALVAQHVGERVQVTGTIVQPAARPTATGGQAEPSTPKSSQPPTLRVESVQKTSSDSTVCRDSA